MASAIGAALISTILEPMAAKAMHIIKDKGLAIGKYIEDKVVDGIVNIERDISKLQTTLRTIRGIVQVAEEKQIDDDFIRNWLHDLVDIAYEARDVLEDFNTFSSCVIRAEEASNPVNFISSLMLSYFSGSSSDTSNIPLTVLNRFEKDIRRVRERFDEKKKEGKTFATTKDSKRVRVERTKVGHSINKQSDYKFVERKEVKEGIMEKILRPSDDRVDVVVIWGMGGIGKTTLAQSIYNDDRVRENDYPTKNKRWLCVGINKFSAEKVIKEIVNDQNTIGIGNLQTKLKEKLRGDRFLIVLDDIWDVDGSEWDLLFSPLTNVGKGGLIIITTRKREVFPALIKIQMAYSLKPLSEEDSWSIFESCAFIDGKSDTTPELKRIGEEIVKRLNGHPLALQVVGRSLLNKDYSTWTNFLESKFSEDDEVMSALRWSYNHLPPHLKMCFTYCSLFPKGHVFDKNVLVQMWMAHDLIKKEKKKRPEDVGAEYFEQLLNASLLQCVDGKYTMHDLVHDLALLVSNEEFTTANSSLTNDQMVRHITITCGEYWKVPHLCKIEKLLTLYTTDRNTTDDKIYPTEKYVLDVFNQLKSIRVLVLVSWEITDIPDCISELRHLRYLDVSKTRVKSLPDSLCLLYNLQMLAARLDEFALPIDIVNISSLRCLKANLSTCKGVGKLTSLQELSSIHVCEGDNIRELGDMQILRRKLRIEGLENVSTLEGDDGALMEKQERIDELELHFNKQLEKSTISEKVLDSLGCPPNLMYLRIAGYNGLKPPSWMVDGKHKFHKLRTLVLDSCSKLESLPPLGEFANFMTYLSRLEICDCDGLKRLQLDALVSLKELTITRCSSLVQITSAICEQLRISSCRLLEKMDVARCDSLQVVIKILKLEYCESLRSLSIDIHGLVSLQDLRIRGCSQLELAFEDGSSSSSSSGNSVAVPIHNIRTNSLDQITSAICESLEISSCRRLEKVVIKILKLEVVNCRLLEKMDVARCDSLQVVIKSLQLYQCESLRSLSINIHGMDSLEHLDINDCPTLKLAFEDGSSSSSSSGNSVAVPIHNIRTNSTQVFRTLLHHEIVSLKSLDITNLGGFENFDETEANNFCKSRSLKFLVISQCDDLKSLPADFHKLSSLESLSIDHCPQLQSLPPDFHKLSSLENLVINDCPQLQSLPPDFHKLSSLEKLVINNCPQLQPLPPDFHKLSSLKSLGIYDCPQLQSLPTDGLPHSLRNLTICTCPQLQSLPPDFHKLSSLNRLSIIYCPQLQSLPPDFPKLSSLKRLYIYFCPQLQSLPVDGFPPSLTYLRIICCPLLYERCKDESSLDWHKINHIRDRQIRRRY